MELLCLGCQAVAAISRNRFSGQTRMVKDDAISPLIRLLKLPRTTRKVTLAVLDAIKSLCISKMLLTAYLFILLNNFLRLFLIPLVFRPAS